MFSIGNRHWFELCVVTRTDYIAHDTTVEGVFLEEKDANQYMKSIEAEFPNSYRIGGNMEAPQIILKDKKRDLAWKLNFRLFIENDD